MSETMLKARAALIFLKASLVFFSVLFAGLRVRDLWAGGRPAAAYLVLAGQCAFAVSLLLPALSIDGMTWLGLAAAAWAAFSVVISLVFGVIELLSSRPAGRFSEPSTSLYPMYVIVFTAANAAMGWSLMRPRKAVKQVLACALLTGAVLSVGFAGSKVPQPGISTTGKPVPAVPLEGFQVWRLSFLLAGIGLALESQEPA